MSIRVRLVVSYLAMLIIPIVLTIISAIVILGAFTKGSHNPKLDNDPFLTIIQKAVTVYSDVLQKTSSEPDILKDVNYLKKQDEKLKDINSGIIVKKDGKVIYKSNIIDDSYISGMSEGGGNRREKEHLGFSKENKQYAEIPEINFVFSDKSTGTITFIADVSPIESFFKKYFTTLFYAFVIIMILTNAVLTYIISRSILRPLKQLKNGALKIKEGNLDFVMECKSRDEIGQVCRAFEEMRSKLKGSIDLQMQYEENRKELISSISHDLKTPITSIKGYVEGIMDGVAETPEKMDKYIKTIYSKATDMDRLIDDLFLFSKLDLKKHPFNFEKMDIKTFFNDSKDELKFDLEKNGIEINLGNKLGEDVKVVADRDKLKRVVLNIVENAVKYMDKDNGVINIKLDEDLEFVKVEIQDNGPGISREELPFIFERFYRADQSRNTSTGGSGLGLAIAKQIIEGHGGSIWALSESNTGTSIFFTLKKV